MSVKLLTEYHLEFLSLKGGCTGSSEYKHVKMPHCLKSHVAAQINYKKHAFDVTMLTHHKSYRDGSSALWSKRIAFHGEVSVVDLFGNV